MTMMLPLWLSLLALLLPSSFAFRSATLTRKRRLEHDNDAITRLSLLADAVLKSSETDTTTDQTFIQQDRQRELAFQIASTFESRTFCPASKLLANRHIQTLSGALLRDVEACRYVTTTRQYENPMYKVVDPGIGILASSLLTKRNKQPTKTPVWDERERFETPDDDFFDVDFKYATNTNNGSTKGLVMVVHGLQSSSHSSLVQEMARVHVQNGFDVAAINFRGCSGEPNKSLKSYHLGFTDDVKQLIAIMSDRLNDERTIREQPIPMYLTGKSLGASVVLKALGELGDDAVEKYNIQGAAVNCCPFDNKRNSNFLLKGFSKVVYNANLLNSLKSIAMRQLEQFDDTPEAALVDRELLERCTDITEFDKAFTAPIFGYRDQWDYYNQSSALNYMDRIRTPTLIFNSRDDPFFDPVYYPWDYHCHSVAGEKRRSPIRIVRSDYGGHLGFMFHNDSEAIEDLSTSQASFMPTELGRFINHVHDSMKDPDSLLAEERLLIPSKGAYSSDPTLAAQQFTDIETDAQTFREQAFLLASSFEPREFRPLPKLANEHLQTISGVFLRHDPDCRYVSGDMSIATAIEKGTKLLSSLSREPDVYGDFWDQRQRIKTPDGDFFHVDYKYQSDDFELPSSKGLVIIVHGLQSNSNSSLSVDLGRAYSNEGFDVACINFRGCSGVPNKSLRAYHLGFTDDLIQFLTMLNSGKLKPSPIFLSGFSLGANVVLKALGELGARAHDELNVMGAAVSGAPFDNERNINFVQKAGFNKLAYNDSLLKSLKTTALIQLDRFSETKEAKTLSLQEISTLKKISAIECALVAPVFGFRDNVDYYRKTNCINFLDDIAVPTLILNAADDPFFDPDFFPWEKGCDSAAGKERRSPIKLVRTDHGGHLGFMFHQRHPDEASLKPDQVEVSFMPQELARFVSHVFEGFAA